MKLELHIIQNFAPSCLNRDDVNAPKDCEFGGFRRARISSQCLKRAIRMHWNQAGLVEDSRATRTRLLVGHVAGRLAERGWNEDEALRVVRFVVEGASKLVVKSDGTTEYLLFLGNRPIEKLTDALDSHREVLVSQSAVATSEDTGAGEGKEKKKKRSTVELPATVAETMSGLFDGTSAADMALFGRMIADSPDKNVEAACQVAHAFSTHPVTMEMDYFTAVDDLQAAEDPGAGMIGTAEFNSACYYRYSVVDARQLLGNLGGDADLARRTLRAYVESAAKAVPSARQNSTAAHNQPDFIFAVIRERGTPLSLANAFERPVFSTRRSGDGFVSPSISRLDEYWGQLTRAYGFDGIRSRHAVAVRGDALPNIGDDKKVESLTVLVDLVDGVWGS